MPHRTLLSPEQRKRLLDIPTEAAAVAKHYVLSAEDLALVRAKRRPNNRLGYAVQLCVLRHPGRPPEPSEVPPAAMLAFVANQVGADPKLFGDYVAQGAVCPSSFLVSDSSMYPRNSGPSSASSLSLQSAMLTFTPTESTGVPVSSL